MDGHTEHDSARTRPWLFWVVGVTLVALLAGIGAAAILTTGTGTRRSTQVAATPVAVGRTTSTPTAARGAVAGSRRTTTTAPSTTTTAPAPGIVTGRITAIGDSVMLDYADPLRVQLPGVDVQAAVSRQWSDGEALVQSVRSEDQLGSEVVIGLGTNGPITDADVDTMMSLLAGVARVVFVTVHVDRPWQDPNNAVLARAASRYPNVALADWATLAAQNPEWFGPDGTHLAIDGPGADALAALVAATLENR